MKFPTLPSILAGTIAGACASTTCLAEIHVLRCMFDKMNQWVYFTRYSDGTPTRVGIGIGVGDKALTFHDRTGALIFIETNVDGTPISFTTIEPTLRAFHSRHTVQLDGTVLAPSHSSGRCEPVAIR